MHICSITVTRRCTPRVYLQTGTAEQHRATFCKFLDSHSTVSLCWGCNNHTCYRHAYHNQQQRVSRPNSACTESPPPLFPENGVNHKWDPAAVTAHITAVHTAQLLITSTRRLHIRPCFKACSAAMTRDPDQLHQSCGHGYAPIQPQSHHPGMQNIMNRMCCVACRVDIEFLKVLLQCLL
jgi:hypothetical protein